MVQPNNLEQYLKKCYENNIIDHSIRAYVDENGKVTFYIHADKKDSNTLDFEVKENLLKQLHTYPNLDFEKNQFVLRMTGHVADDKKQEFMDRVIDLSLEYPISLFWDVLK